VQSKDLIESSAQRASSVSPAHFRSALQHSRRILASVSIGPLEAGSSRRVSTRRSASSSSPAKSTSRQDAEEGDAGAGEDVSGTGSNVPSPYSTPRKKFKYSSGVDISGLVKTTPGRRQGLGTPSKSFHEPSIASPLRHSVTPATRNRTKEGEATSAVAEQGDGDAEAGSEVGTPSKKVKYAVQPGVDLEAVSNDVRPPAGLSSTPRRGNEDTSSFFAFRPGSGAQPSSSRPRRVRGVDVDERGSRVPIPLEDGLPNVRQTRHSLLKSAKQGAVVKKKRTRRDWRYPEVVWAGKAVQEENARVIKQVSCAVSDLKTTTKLTENRQGNDRDGRLVPGEGTCIRTRG
jgi:hypothetical protein